MTAMTAPTAEPRDRLVLSLDFDSLPAARALARRLAAWFATVKIGYELYAEAGPAAIDAFHDDGFKVFADLKLFDIPTTVERGARVLGRRGTDFLNLHAAGGVTMLRAGATGLAEGARAGGHPPPVALAVTVLSSEPDATAVGERLRFAHDAGCGGVVCAAAEAAAAAALGLTSMVPGIRLADGDAHDQARVATPADALHAGATWIILGRAVTAADDPEAAAARVAPEVTTALH
jgi:orotidine-5'-phosphate decarboxylase